MAEVGALLLKEAQPYLEILKVYAEDLRISINTTCSGLEAWQIIAFTFGFTLLAVWLYDFLLQEDSLTTRVKKSFFKFMRSLPFVKAKIEKEMKGTIDSLEKTFNRGLEDFPYYEGLPQKGYTEKEVMEELKRYKKLSHVNWSIGSCSGTVYSGEESLTRYVCLCGFTQGTLYTTTTVYGVLVHQEGAI